MTLQMEASIPREQKSGHVIETARLFMRHPAALTYRFTSVPNVPPVLRFMQQQAQLSEREAYSSLNMGAGFALFVAPEQAGQAVEVARQLGIAAYQAGVVEAGQKRVIIEPLNVEFAQDELTLRA